MSESNNLHSRREANKFRHTRTSTAWASVVIATLFGVALVDFIAQNTQHIRVEFFGMSGHLPTAVALLASALAGAIVVLAVGVGRVAQLRFTMRRQQRATREGATDHQRGSPDLERGSEPTED